LLKKAYLQKVNKLDKAILEAVKILLKDAQYAKMVQLVKIRRILRKWITVEHEAALKLYTTSYYIKLNKVLRELANYGNDEMKLLKAMQEVMDDALSKLPVFEQNGKELLRSAQYTETQIQQMFVKGKPFLEKAFFSTTYSPKVLSKWMANNPSDNVVFKVFGKNGKLIEGVSMVPESEVLFKSGTEFIVESVKKIEHPLFTRAKNGDEVFEIILKEI
jgi:hypothetical protein